MIYIIIIILSALYYYRFLLTHIWAQHSVLLSHCSKLTHTLQCLVHYFHMTLNTSMRSSAESQNFAKEEANINAKRLAENNCLGSSPAQFQPPFSPGWERRSRGRHVAGEALRSGRSLEEACGGEEFTGRGSALLEVLDINGKAFSVPHRAAEEPTFISLFLSHHRGKTMSKKHVAGIFSGKDRVNICNPIPIGGGVCDYVLNHYVQVV